MPPEIATFLCFTFILVILVLDKRRNPNVSFVLWIPLFWLMVRGSRPLGLWYNGLTGYSGVANLNAIAWGSSIDRVFLSGCIVLGLYLSLKRNFAWGVFFKENKWIIFLYVVCFISLLWSDHPFVAFKRWIRGIGALSMSVLVLTEPNRFEALKTMMLRCAYILIPISILLIKYYRELGVVYGNYGGAVVCGVATHKNSLGLLCAILGLFFFWNLETMWRDRNSRGFLNSESIINILITIMILWLFGKAQSATSFACLIVGISVYIVLGSSFFRNNPKKIGCYAFIISLCCLLILLFSYEAIFLFSAEHLGRSDTFWSRVLLWKVLLEMETNPLLGVGYDSFWLGERLETLWGIYWWNPTQAHNGFLDVYLELGLMGLLVWAGVIISSFLKVIKTLQIDYDFGRFQFAFLVMFLLHNFTEASMKIRSLFWLVFLFVILSYQHKSKSQSPARFAPKDTRPPLK